MEKNVKMYWTLFSSVFVLSACTFGGGFVIVPLMRKKFVEDLHWIDENEMMDLVAIAQSSPGAIAVNASISIGYRCAGLSGALVAVFGTVLPPLIILTTISYFYEAFIKIRWIQILLFGMQAGVVATICDVVWTMGKEVWNQKQKVYALIMLAAFICNIFFEVNLLVIIVTCGLLGYLIDVYVKKVGDCI